VIAESAPTASDDSPAHDGLSDGQIQPLFQRSELREWVGLLALLASFVVVVAYLGELRAENFFTSNWDLGINQQMLWTTGHGSLLYESGDFEFYGVHSFLQVHSGYMALLIAPIYLAAPIPATLFAVQATVFAASAVPLYLLGKSIVRRRVLLFGAILLYVVNFAVISALFYDFHWEAFIPLEFLCFFLLVQRRRYALSLVPLLAGMFTLEVFPFLAAGVILYFLVDRLTHDTWTWKRTWTDREIRLLLGLLVIAGVTYAVLRVLQYVVIPHFVGVPGSTSGAANSLTASLTFSATSATLARTGLYWLLILACLGFLPILSPKHLILTIPWFVESTFFSPSFASQFGNQYALIAMAGVSVAFLHGLGKLESSRLDFTFRTGIVFALIAEAAALTLFAASRADSRTLLSGAVSVPLGIAMLAGPIVALLLWWLGNQRRTPTPTVETHGRVGWQHRTQAPLLVGFIAVLIAFSVAMSPVNTNNFEATPYPGYAFEWSENPAAGQMSWVTGHVPGGAVILASDNLFPYVANDRNAYALPWFTIGALSPAPFFPFTPTNLPQFVLVDTSQLPFVPAFLQQDMFNGTAYGLVAYVYTTGFPGTVYLFEEGYTQPAAGRDLETPPVNAYFSAANLSLGPAGRVVPSPTAKFGSIVTSGNSSFSPGNNAIWYGPYVTLLPGSYRVVFNLTGLATDASKPLLDLSAGIFSTGGTLCNFTWSVVYARQLAPVGWTDLAYNLTLDKPYPLLEFRGLLELHDGVPNGTVTLNYIEVEPVA
jgi:uncharacterized membrane protein